jgi:integrase
MNPDTAPTSSELMPVKSGKRMASASKDSSWPKTDFRHWESRVFHAKRGGIDAVSNGTVRETTLFHVRIGHDGRRGSFSTGESSQRRAAKRALEIWLFLRTNGWDAALAKYRQDRDPDEQPRPITVGEFIALAEGITSVRARTFADYARAFRRIVADIAGVKETASRFDYRAGGRDKWLAKVNRVHLEDITPEKVRRWANEYAKTAGGDPLAEKRAKNSANSLMRQAKSLFGMNILPHVRKLVEGESYVFPGRLPFDGVRFFERSSSRYHSKVDAGELLVAAQTDLAEAAPESWKIFLLALAAGLRRAEIDSLIWRQVDLERGLIRIEETPYFKPKSSDSCGEVELEPEIVELFRGYRARAKGPFVIDAESDPRPGATYSYTRAKMHFEALYDWLRSRGVDDRKPLHVLRKEFGSLVCEKFGIFAASKALRHADIAVTAAHYLDKKERVSVGLGALLKPDNVVEIANQSETSKLASR